MGLWNAGFLLRGEECGSVAACAVNGGLSSLPAGGIECQSAPSHGTTFCKTKNGSPSYRFS
jgi:hypothetical protein